MTLTTPNDNQPDWVKSELGLEEYKEFKLGQKVKVNQDWVYIIHIQKNEGEEALFRGMLSNGASITMTYHLINKPVETTNEQPKSKCKCMEGFQDLCSNFIENGPLEGHCQLNCIDTFRPVG